MNEELRPIKRSEQLTPLSREHHDGLLFVYKIRRGLKNKVAVERISSFVNWFWDNHLEQHFRKEEEVLIPVMPFDDEKMTRMSEEHEEIEALVHINRNIADGAILDSIADKINDHIRFEERVLFPHIENQLPVAKLDEILEKLTMDAPSCGEWKDEFWKGANS